MYEVVGKTGERHSKRLASAWDKGVFRRVADGLTSHEMVVPKNVFGVQGGGPTPGKPVFITFQPRSPRFLGTMPQGSIPTLHAERPGEGVPHLVLEPVDVAAAREAAKGLPLAGPKLEIPEGAVYVHLVDGRGMSLFLGHVTPAKTKHGDFLSGRLQRG